MCETQSEMMRELDVKSLLPQAPIEDSIEALNSDLLDACDDLVQH